MGEEADELYALAMRDEYEDVKFEEHTALAVAGAQQALAMPVVTPAEAKEAMKQYLALCEAILSDDDYQEFTQWDPKLRKKVQKRFKKKSAVKKLQTFYNITVTIVREDKDDIGDGNYGFRVVARATMPSGKFSEASAACTSLEDRFDVTKKDDESASAFAGRQKKALARAYHDILSTAQTRASNRAVMDCLGLGGGEVTAEEMSTKSREHREEVQQQQKQQPRYTREEQIRIERTVRIKNIFTQCKRMSLATDDGVPVADGPSLYTWTLANTAGCDDWIQGQQPSLIHLTAIEDALLLIAEQLESRGVGVYD